MNADPQSVRRGICFALCLLVLATSTGCVYWRLFKMRRQLAAFDTHCTVTHDPGAVIRFTQPLLKPTDVEWLLQRPAEQTGNSRRYRLQKRGDPAADDPLARVDIVFLIENDRVRQVTFPPQFNPVLDHDTLSRVFVGADTADVEKSTHRTGWQLHHDLQIPRMDRARSMLGTPTRREDTELHHVLVYEYDLPAENPVRGDPDVSGILVFDRREMQVVHAVIRVGALGITVFREPAGPYRVNLRHHRS